MRQYEIWWTELPEPIGGRPVMLLSRDAGYAYLEKYIVVEITTRIRAIPEEVMLGKREGLPRRCVANFDNIHIVGREELIRCLGKLTPRRVPEVKRALGHALGWPELLVED